MNSNIYQPAHKNGTPTSTLNAGEIATQRRIPIESRGTQSQVQQLPGSYPDAASKPSYDYGSPAANAAAQKLVSMGCIIHPPGNAAAVDWGTLAGYELQKRAIEDTLLLALLHPETFDDVARGTRKHFVSNRPRAVLFEGPPGCGKTTSARWAEKTSDEGIRLVRTVVFILLLFHSVHLFCSRFLI